MSMVTEAKSALKNGTSTILSSVRHSPKATRRFLAVDSHRLMRRVTRPFERQQSRRMPIVPIVLVTSAAVLGTTIAILVRRLLAANSAGEESTEYEFSPNGQPDEELVMTR